MEEKLIREALRMLRDRERYWTRTRYTSEGTQQRTSAEYSRFAYSSAADILQYAIEGKSDCMAQFDYYGEDA